MPSVFLFCLASLAAQVSSLGSGSTEVFVFHSLCILNTQHGLRRHTTLTARKEWNWSGRMNEALIRGPHHLLAKLLPYRRSDCLEARHLPNTWIRFMQRTSLGDGSLPGSPPFLLFDSLSTGTCRTEHVLGRCGNHELTKTKGSKWCSSATGEGHSGQTASFLVERHSLGMHSCGCTWSIWDGSWSMS